MNVLIVEDHPLVTMGIRMIISESDSKAQIRQAETFPVCLDLLERESFDILILDIDIPGGENIAMVGRIHAAQHKTRILIHSGYDETVYALPYLRAGADGFLSKRATQAEFKTAWKALSEKRKYVSYGVQQIMLDSIRENNNQKSINPITSLSPREVRVMELMTEGKWTKEIADIMNLKENTVSTYKRRIYDKLQVNDPIELSRKVSLLKYL